MVEELKQSQPDLLLEVVGVENVSEKYSRGCSTVAEMDRQL